MSETLTEASRAYFNEKKSRLKTWGGIGLILMVLGFVFTLVSLSGLLPSNRYPSIDMVFHLGNQASYTRIEDTFRLHHLPKILNEENAFCAEHGLTLKVSKTGIPDTRSVSPKAQALFLQLYSDLSVSTQPESWKSSYDALMKLQHTARRSHLRMVYGFIAVFLMLMLAGFLLNVVSGIRFKALEGKCW